MADYEQLGYLGRKQFTDLLGILQIYPDDDTLESMFLEMDENGDGQIQFDGTRARAPLPACAVLPRGGKGTH